MVKRLLYFLPVMVIAIVIAVACSTEEEKEKFGEISGIVFDENVGEPLSIAQITLTPGGNSTVTGSDGSFSFLEILPGNYTITVNKKGYEQEGKNTVTVVSGKRAECNIKMKRIPAYVTADKEVLDFGDNNTLNTLSFNIVNGSYENLSWHIYYDTISSFVTQVSPDKGTTPYGKTAAIVVKINREKLNAGNNETTIQVISDNGDGSSEVRIKAIGQEKAVPTLIYTETTKITSSTAIVHGKITFWGIPAYTERGFVYNKEENPTIKVDNNIEKVMTPVTGDSTFSYKLKDLEINQKYYVRAYAINDVDVVYSNQESFTTIPTLPEVYVFKPINPDADKKTATLLGEIHSIGDPEYYERGFIYCKGRHTPTIGDSVVSIVKEPVPGTGVGSFDANISFSKLGVYSVRSYAKSKAGYAYSERTEELELVGDEPQVSVEKTTDVNLIERTAILHGNLVAKGSPAATIKGFVYSSVNKMPTLEDYHVEVEKESGGHETGSYIMTISNLELSKKYYVRAYAKNEEGIAYSDTISFDTNPIAPSISVLTVTNTSIKEKTAIFKGTVSSVGNPEYSERGFVYSTTNNKPNIYDSYVKVDGKGVGTYETTVSNLELGKTYYVRAYAVNEAGTTYSKDVVEFSTVPTAAKVKMRSVTNVDRVNLTALFQGSVETVGDPSYSERGFVYSSTNNTPTINDSHVKVDGSGTGSYETTVSNLVLGKTYYVRAYAINEAGISYSSSEAAVVFSTVPTKPSVVMESVRNLDPNSKTGVFYGRIIGKGDPAYTERGFVYSSKNDNPTISDVVIKVDNVTTDTYDKEVSGLVLGTRYYVRAYAINVEGISYSDTISFILPSVKPIVSVGETSNINLTELSSILHGNMESTGAPVATEKGFVYSTVNKTPTINDVSVKVDGIEVGSYYATINQLELNKTYYVRAYAKNEEGIVYSLETTSFNTTPNAPSVLVRSVSDLNLSEKTVVFKGSVTSVGDPAYSERGFVYSSTNNTPNINDSYVKVDGKGVGTYETTVSNLELGKTYYVRAYAVNEAGATYSKDVIEFSTVPTAATVNIKSVTNVDRVNLTALFQGSVETMGDPPYSERGFVYSSTNNTPTIDDSHVKVAGSGTGSYETTVSNLVLGKSYYVRAYAINEAGATYSKNVVSFELTGTSPEVSVSAVSDINLSSLSVTLNGYVNEVGYPTINERGFVYSYDNITPSMNDSKATAKGVAIGGSYSVQIDDLALDKIYYVKAYVSNSTAVYYSKNTISFSTEAILPIVSVSSPTNVDLSAFTATITGRIEDSGNPKYTEKGFVYGYNDTVPIVGNDNVENVSGDQTGTYSTTLTGLVLGKKYYVRAFAKNAKGIAYSNTVSFLFDQTKPVVTTDSVTNVDINTPVAILHGFIADVGNPAYQERGFVLSTQYEFPTIDDQRIPISGSGTGNFEYRLTEFSKTEKTYVRAYAINEKGVAYGKSVALFDPSFLDMGEYIILSDLGIAVQKEDIGLGYWHDMNRLCNNSNVGGFSDWRLPTYNELCQLYNISNQIGNFQTAIYWSSDNKRERKSYNSTYYYINYYGVNFINGSKYTSNTYDSYYQNESATGSCYARAVRNLNQE